MLLKLRNISFSIPITQFFTSRGYTSIVPVTIPASIESERHSRVAVFWDLDNKPPKSTSPYEAAIKLRAAAASFGIVRYMVAYANRTSCSQIPKAITQEKREWRKIWDLENAGLIRTIEPYKCGVCGRKFYNGERLTNHFRQVHETEHRKRVNQIESAKGKKRVNLIGRYAMKMEKYRNAAKGMVATKASYSIADQVARAGVVIKTVPDRAQSADVALKEHIGELVERRSVECVVLVSDDCGFVETVEEARLRSVRTVVIGECRDGGLKRVADLGFNWGDVIGGKVKKVGGKVVGRWKDRDMVKQLEWKYKGEKEVRRLMESEGEDDDMFDEDNESEDASDDDWWELDSLVENSSSLAK